MAKWPWWWLRDIDLTVGTLVIDPCSESLDGRHQLVSTSSVVCVRLRRDELLRGKLLASAHDENLVSGFARMFGGPANQPRSAESAKSDNQARGHL